MTGLVLEGGLTARLNVPKNLHRARLAGRRGKPPCDRLLFAASVVYGPVKQKFRLLIVDDDARIRELAVFAAERAAVFESVRTADDGSSALEWLSHCTEAELPDVILTDLHMPRIDGVELARMVHEHPRWREIPLAMFSSTTPPDEDPQALGCRAFFMKPLDMAELTRLMTTVGELAESGSAVPH